MLWRKRRRRIKEEEVKEVEGKVEEAERKVGEVEGGGESGC